MATVYKWYPGHYLLGAGSTRDLTTLLNGIASTTAPTSNIPNLIGVQIRYIWRQLEVEEPAGSGTYVYKFQSILDDLQTLKARSDAIGRKLYLRILLQFKGIGGRGAPNYLRPGQSGYRSEYGIGVYTWGNAENPDAINEHPALWIPAVEERLALFMEAMGQELDSIGRPAGDIRYHLSTVDFNETSWGNNNGTALTSTQQAQQKDALLRIQQRTKVKFPTTIVGHFVNFPPYAVTNMCGPMIDAGITLGGPDTWWNDSSVENGVYLRYADAQGKTAISPSIQNQNWEHNSHADATATPRVYSIAHLKDASGNPTLQKVYDRMTTTGVTVDSTFRAGLRGTHITWQAATWALHNPDGSLSSLKPWDLIRNFFYNKWITPGPDYQNTTPGVVTTIPSRLETSAPPPPPSPPGGVTLALTTDTGPFNTDKITSNAAVTVTATAGATIQYATADTGPWSSTAPTPVQGTNTWYARQVVSGTPSAASAPLTFVYDNDPPDLAQITVNANVLLITYTDTANLSNVTGFKAPLTAFVVKANGSTVAVTGAFVNEDMKRVRLDLGSSVASGATVTVSYTQPTSGTNRTQDYAGNYAANFTDAPVINTTGLSTPTTTATVVTVAGKTAGSSINSAAPAAVGTISAGLTGAEVLEIQRLSGSASTYTTLGNATVTGTDWTFADSGLAEGSHTYRARVRVGDLLGPFSATFAVIVDLTPPLAPSVTGASVPWNQAPTILGSWGNGAGDTLSVAVGGDIYTTANGLTIAGTSWTLALPVMEPGRYALTAVAVDAAGNIAVDEDDADLVVAPRPSLNHARLAKARRRR
jgi:hypothetical protein